MTQDRYRSGKWKKTTYVCYCGSRSEGALSRDMHNASHMLIRPPFFKKNR